MKNTGFFKGIKIESNTYYTFSAEKLDYYLADTVRSYNAEYRSHSKGCGEYLDIAFLLCDLENVVLDFGGATMVFHGRIQPFMLDNCKNVTIKNLKIDYDRPFYTQATILNCTENEMRIRFDEDFPCRVTADRSIVAVSETWEKKLNTFDCLLWPYDPEDKRDYPIILALFGDEIFPQDNPPMPINKLIAREDGDNVILTGEFPKEWIQNSRGDKLLITHEVRDKNTIQLVGGENITIDNVQIIHGASMALTAMHTKNIYVNHFDFIGNCNNSGRIVTNNADAIHLFNCYGKFELKNSTMEGLLDDTVNVHGNYLMIDEVGDDSVWCGNITGLTPALKVVLPGDKVAVFKGRTQAQAAELTVKAVADTDARGGRTLTFEEADAVGKLSAGDVIENLSANPEVLIENCDFLRFRGTMRLQSRAKMVVRNCRFKNRMVSILFSGDTTYWFESAPSRDYLIENCYFGYADNMRIVGGGDVEYTEKEPYYHKNITVKNCFFDGSEALSLYHADNITFIGNKTSAEKMNVTLRDCGKHNIEDATVSE